MQQFSLKKCMFKHIINSPYTPSPNKPSRDWNPCSFMPSFRQQSSLHPMKGSVVLKPKKKQQQMEADKARRAKDPGKKRKLNHQYHHNLDRHKTTETGNDKQLEVVVNPPRVMLSSA
ncbi:hypothetical protein NC652_011119 [Populus alba x Populus x berolinensis]|nr:hypothetical protein NC652_011119 [Populus alba x Populus x berolinensis]